MASEVRPTDTNGVPRMIDGSPRALGRRCYVPMDGAATRCGLPGDVVRTVIRKHMATCEDCVTLLHRDANDPPA